MPLNIFNKGFKQENILKILQTSSNPSETFYKIFNPKELKKLQAKSSLFEKKASKEVKIAAICCLYMLDNGGNIPPSFKNLKNYYDSKLKLNTKEDIYNLDHSSSGKYFTDFVSEETIQIKSSINHISLIQLKQVVKEIGIRRNNFNLANLPAEIIREINSFLTNKTDSKNFEITSKSIFRAFYNKVQFPHIKIQSTSQFQIELDKFIKQTNNIDELDLSNIEIDKECLNILLVKLTTKTLIKKLNLTNCCLTKEHFLELRLDTSSLNLQQLVLDNNNLIGIGNYLKIRSLTHLSLKNSQLNSEDYQNILLANSELTHLNVAKNNITHLSISATHYNLKYLDANSNSKNSSFNFFFNFPNLIRLNIENINFSSSDNEIQDKFIDQILKINKNMPKLKYLYIKDTTIKNDSANLLIVQAFSSPYINIKNLEEQIKNIIKSK